MYAALDLSFTCRARISSGKLLYLQCIECTGYSMHFGVIAPMLSARAPMQHSGDQALVSQDVKHAADVVLPAQLVEDIHAGLRKVFCS